MALSREERGNYARELMAADPTLDLALALSQVDEMEAQGAFTPITNEQDISQEEMDSLFNEDDISQDEMDALFEEDFISDDEADALFAPESPVESSEPIPTTNVWQDTSDEFLDAPVEPMPLSPSTFPSVTEAPTSFADGGMEAGLGASIRPKVEASEDELKQREFERRHSDRYAPQREAVKAAYNTVVDTLSDFDSWMGETFTAPEDKGQYATSEAPEQALKEDSAILKSMQGMDTEKLKAKDLKEIVDIEKEEGVTATWEDIVENNARELYVSGKYDTPDEAREAARKEHDGNVMEGAVNFATLFIPGVAPARWGAQFVKMTAGKQIAALMTAGVAENVAAGIAGNMAAGREWDEGIDDDALFGAVGGGAVGLGGQAVRSATNAYKARKLGNTEEVAAELVTESATRQGARDKFQTSSELKEAVEDIAKNVDTAKPHQVAKAVDALPEGQVKDKMSDLSEGMNAFENRGNAASWARALPDSEAKQMLSNYHPTPLMGAENATALKEASRKYFQNGDNLNSLFISTRDTLRDLPDTMDNAATREMLEQNLDKLKKMGGARKFFKEEDNIRRAKETVGDLAYEAEKLVDESTGKYTALARLMDEGETATMAIDTSYLGESKLGNTLRNVEGKVGAGIPARLRSAEFNKAQEGVRETTLEAVTKRIDELSGELSDDALKGAKRKGKRHELNEMRKVADNISEGKEVKVSDYAKSWNYLPKGLQRELDGLQALQQYSKATKAKETPTIIDASTSAMGHAALAYATGGASLIPQTATALALPVLRGMTQGGKKKAIKEANELVVKHNGDMTSIMEEINTMKGEDAQRMLSLMLFRYEAMLSTPVEFEGAADALEDYVWQE